MNKKLLLAALIAAVTMPTMAQENTRTALLHLKSGAVKEFNVADIDSITFSAPVNYDSQINAKYGIGFYYGNGQYFTCLSTDSLSPNGGATKAGQRSVIFYALGKPSLSSKNAILPSGRYVSSTSQEDGTLYDGKSYLYASVATAGDSTLDLSTVYLDKGAEANVEYNSDGTYTIDFKGRSTKADNMDFENIHCVFNGTIPYANKDAAYYETFTEDVNFQPTGFSGGYSNSSDYGDYTLSFYNMPVDDEGFTAGAGDLVNLELLTDTSSVMDLSKLVGTYTVASSLEGPYEPGHWLDGVNYYYYGMYMCVGTYICSYDNQGYATNHRDFAKSGTITISDAGDQLHVVCDLTLEGGHKLTLDQMVAKGAIAERGTGAKGDKFMSPALKTRPLAKAKGNVIKMVRVGD